MVLFGFVLGGLIMMTSIQIAEAIMNFVDDCDIADLVKVYNCIFEEKITVDDVE